MGKEIVNCDKIAQPIGAYSLAVKKGALLYSSGQIALSPENGELIGETAREQSQRVMENIAVILDEANSSFVDMLKVTIYLKNMADFVEVNEVYSSYFQGSYPARSTVAVSDLPKGALVEIDFIACCS